mmetsp:Transcript_3002/g.11171  ORF Transcript_3002/g.11171 Transcript_3002/m.11171 type:complete len:208 (+) Transcript_3002:932-1555(+)
MKLGLRLGHGVEPPEGGGVAVRAGGDGQHPLERAQARRAVPFFFFFLRLFRLRGRAGVSLGASYDRVVAKPPRIRPPAAPLEPLLRRLDPRDRRQLVQPGGSSTSIGDAPPAVGGGSHAVGHLAEFLAHEPIRRVDEARDVPRVFRTSQAPVRAVQQLIPQPRHQRHANVAPGRDAQAQEPADEAPRRRRVTDGARRVDVVPNAAAG